MGKPLIDFGEWRRSARIRIGGGRNCCAAFHRAVGVQGVHGVLGVGIWVYGVLEYFDILASCRKKNKKRKVHFLPYMRNLHS